MMRAGGRRRAKAPTERPRPDASDSAEACLLQTVFWLVGSGITREALGFCSAAAAAAAAAAGGGERRGAVPLKLVVTTQQTKIQLYHLWHKCAMYGTNTGV